MSHSFEKYTSFSVQAWSNAIDAGVSATVGLDNTTQVNPNARVPSLKISYASGSGVAGAANRGMGGEGLYLAAGRPYDGFAVVLAPAGGTLAVAVRPRGGGPALAAQTLELAASAEWQVANFSLSPQAGAECEGIAPGSDPSVDCGALSGNPGSVCVRCGAEFVVGLARAGTVNVGFVDLYPALTWGSVGPASQAMVDAARAMGVGFIRMGGTVAQ